MVAGLKKHQPCRARALCAAPVAAFEVRIYRRSQTVCFSRPAKGFHLFDVAWRDLQPTSTDRCHPCARLLHCVPASSPWPLFAGASQWGEQCKKRAKSSAKISHARKKAAAAATVEVAKAPLHAQHNHRDPSFFRRKTLHVNQWETVYAFLHIKCQTFFVLCMTSNIWKVKSNVLYRWN